jgi:hypothetical protein
VGDQDIGSQGKRVSSGLQVPGEPFPFLVGLRTYQHPLYLLVVINETQLDAIDQYDPKSSHKNHQTVDAA